MQNIIDYVNQEMHTFDEKHFCRVDSLVLSQLSYIKFDSIYNYFENENKKHNKKTDNIFEELTNLFKEKNKHNIVKLHLYDLLKSEYFEEMFNETFDPEKSKQLLYAVCSSPRFRNILIEFYISEFDAESIKQFAAMTFILDDNSAYVAYRGTDATLVGWKEDFYMAYTCPVPAQAAACQYLNEVAAFLPLKIYVGGHSKGGNLAVYSVMSCKEDIRNHVVMCFSHDGPGFRDEIVKSKEFQSIASKVYKTIPQDSVIGMLMQNHEHYQVIKSNAIGITQHDAFTWIIENLDFVEVSKITSMAKYTDSTISQWIAKMDDNRRKVFIDELFYVLTSSNARTFDEIKKNWRTSIPAIIEAIKGMDNETKGIMLGIFSDLASSSWKSLK